MTAMVWAIGGMVVGLGIRSLGKVIDVCVFVGSKFRS